MILDERCEFADALTLTGTGQINLGDQIPLTTARNVGSPVKPLYLVISVQGAVTGATSVQFQLVSDAVNPPALDATVTVHAKTNAIPLAQLTANTVVAVIPLPGEPPAYETILGVQAVIVGTATGGTINAFLTPVPPQWKAYPDAT